MSARADTLVIGAGAAGLFFALQAAAHGSVLLLESGADPGEAPPSWALYDHDLPADVFREYRDLDSDQPMRQGHVLGGGSTVNMAAALRGQPWCYDAWGVPGWSWDELLPAFRGIEADQQFGDRAYHGADGLIPMTRLAPGPVDEAMCAW